MRSDGSRGNAAEGKGGDRFRQGILGGIHHPALVIEGALPLFHQTIGMGDPVRGIPDGFEGRSDVIVMPVDIDELTSKI